MAFFLKDIRHKRSVSWDFLIDEINNASSYIKYCKSDDYYTIFKNVVISLLIGKEIILLDSDATFTELKNLTGHADFSGYKTPVDKSIAPTLNNKKELIDKLRNPSPKWRITLFTSGTTGIPKKVSHTFTSITRFVKITEHTKTNVWGFAYNPTHMAGIQVFFQALLNGNSIIRLFGLSNNDIYNEIRNNHITNISATPTFYRLLLPCNEKFTSVKRITSGGEKFNKNTSNQLSEVFPNAKTTNVYASTEAGTLFASQDDIFCVQHDYEDLIRIKNNELLIHGSLIGKTTTNIEEWYNTGDMIEIVSQQPLKFRFLNRKSEMINVGGYKVNPLEVEDVILEIKGINNVRVFPKRNSVLGNIICCEVVTDNSRITESTIRSLLQSKLQEYKIPRIINFVDSLPTTRTGKIKRDR